MLLHLFGKTDPVYKVGLILIAACPGGTASNLVTHLLRGRVALSISLTSFNSFLILFTIPAIMSLAMETYMGQSQHISLSFFDTLEKIGFTVLIPVLIGTLINHYRPELSNRL